MLADNDKYEVLEKIGHGSFGIIRKVRRRADGMIMCRKEISYLKMSQKEREQLHAEFQILSSLRHANIVGYYHREHLKASQDLHLYMEYCGNGDLGRVIRDLQLKNQYAEESFVWSIFSQLVTALFRCHYGLDPPEVGKNVLGLGAAAAKPKVPPGVMTVLHRDLKPENVFLGADNSVKLGDFGLAKMIQSHDFASTYVGTPFYMSPEICAAEKYTLKSDIWSLGCIIYELCTRDPPFNAKSHLQLIQKIKEGKFAPLPAVYSPELAAVIRDCLKVNPDRRPDTATLLNLPVVRLMRKEKEVVEMSKILKTKEDQLNQQIHELDHRLAADKASLRHEIDASLRREWEVKARLEIDRLVNDEVVRLQKRFEHEVQSRVETELQHQEKQLQLQQQQIQQLQQQQQQQQQSSHRKAVAFDVEDPHPDLSSSGAKSDYPPHSSVGTSSADGEFPSTTDITELSIESPDTSLHAVKKTARTPFGRAQTMFAGTPMDVEMASPLASPIAIASLSLSPRRAAATKAPSANPGNIFAAEDEPGPWSAARDSGPPVSDDDEDDEVAMPSPTRMIRSNKNPFAPKQRPVLLSQKSAPLNRLKTAAQPCLPAPAKTPGGAGTDPLRNVPSSGALRERCTSPNRRLSKIPSAANLGQVDLALGGDGTTAAAATAPTAGPALGLTRKPSFNKKEGIEIAPGFISKQKVGVRGRTLVELQQARAGGRPLSAAAGAASGPENTFGSNASPKRPFREHATAANRGGAIGAEPAAVWDPDCCDEMPRPVPG